MKKKLFILFIILMSVSLLGIIFVQGYWINDSIKTKEEQLTLNIKQALISVSRDIKLHEVELYYSAFRELVDNSQEPDNTNIREIIYSRVDDITNEIFIYSNGITEEDYKLSSTFLDIGIDSVLFKKLINRTTTTRITPGVDGSESTSQTITDFRRMDEFERKHFESFIPTISDKIPIHQRVNDALIEKLLNKELKERGIETVFEYAIYSNQLATKVRSNDFELNAPSTYLVPLFVDENENSKYKLFVTFSNSRRQIFSSIIGMTIMSLIFTSVIILAYWNAIRQLIKQRQISQIKTDFINNMTHEFKTPIATINLALDALKNPKVEGNKEFMDRYLKMIREENKRMNAQVENVLRISRLENKSLDLKKERLKIHDLVEDAITHVELLVEDRGGYIKTHFAALKSSVLGNDFHLTNVIVNVLDNAIKYSEGEPKIDVYTENTSNSIILKIRDQGIGMSKAAQKQIFEKFYREHTGNIHNVKGHGLGLAYVKHILDDHQAEIYVESDRGKGSTFILKFQLIS